MLRLIRVSGNSLLPEYEHGDFVLIAKIPILIPQPEKGDLIVFNQPGYGRLIKIVSERLPNDRGYLVTGTQVDSVDSRQFGAVRKDAILGKVIWHIRRPKRNGQDISAE
jgi:signal peptidase I